MLNYDNIFIISIAFTDVLIFALHALYNIIINNIFIACVA